MTIQLLHRKRNNNNCHEDFYYIHTGALSKLYKKSSIEQLFNLNLKLGEDTVYYWQYCLNNNPKISVINEVLYYYRQRKNSTMYNLEQVIDNKLMDSIKYLISQDCFKNTPEYTQAHILDRFLVSYSYQIHEINRHEHH